MSWSDDIRSHRSYLLSRDDLGSRLDQSAFKRICLNADELIVALCPFEVIGNFLDAFGQLLDAFGEALFGIHPGRSTFVGLDHFHFGI